MPSRPSRYTVSFVVSLLLSAECVAVTRFPPVESTPFPSANPRTLRRQQINLTSALATFDKNRAARNVWTVRAIGMSRQCQSMWAARRQEVSTEGSVHP